MTWPPRTNFALKDGTRCLLYALPFDGDGDGDGLHRFDGDGDGTYRFENHDHAENFVRYLFSQNGSHPSNLLTEKNLNREFGPDGKLVGQAYNDDAPRRLSDFLGRRFPARDGHTKLANDGCYPFFIVEANGKMVSNFMTARGGMLTFSHHHREMFMTVLSVQIGESEEFDRSVRDFVGRQTVTDFEDLTDPEDLLVVEALVHGVVRKLLGSPENVILTSSHRDEPEQNPAYHVHRLVSV